METRAITHLQIIEDQLIERRRRYIKLKKLKKKMEFFWWNKIFLNKFKKF